MEDKAKFQTVLNRNQRRQKSREQEKWDNTPAKMKDVDRAVTNVYVILLKLISELNNTCNILADEANRLREERGLPPLEIDAGLEKVEIKDNNGK